MTKSCIVGLLNIKTNHMGTRTVSTALTRKPTSYRASDACLLHHDLFLWRGQGKSTTWKILPRPQAMTHGHPQSSSKCMSESKDQASFAPSSSTSTLNKIGSMLCFCSNSSNSRCSMTPLDTSLYGSFSYPEPSVAGSQQVMNSMWQLPGPFSPTLLPAMDTLSTGQVVEIY